MARVHVIAIVDDDFSVREATRRLVRSLGYIAVAFASAEEFLRSGRVSDTSCLITDVEMPGMNGVDLQDLLLADDHHTPVIFMTAFPTDKLRARALEGGAVGFLSKPFDDNQLLACLSAALAKGVAPSQ